MLPCLARTMNVSTEAPAELFCGIVGRKLNVLASGLLWLNDYASIVNVDSEGVVLHSSTADALAQCQSRVSSTKVVSETMTILNSLLKFNTIWPKNGFVRLSEVSNQFKN